MAAEKAVPDQDRGYFIPTGRLKARSDSQSSQALALQKGLGENTRTAN
jgi:hypothetical protein